MPIFVIPADSLVDLNEFNPCHAPGGNPAGGQFCSDPQAGLPSPVEKIRAREHYEYLKNRYATLDDILLAADPESEHAKAAAAMMRSVVKEIIHLRADTGGPEDIGLPGGPRDVVIIGAGPGGMTAAIAASYEEMDVLLVEASTTPGGQSKRSERIQNFPTFPLGTKGREIAEKTFAQVEQSVTDVRMGVRVTKIDYDPDTEMKTLTLSNGEIVQARTVIIATGGTPRGLEIPGAAPTSITHDAEKLAAKAKGQSVIVVGGGNAAAQAARGAATTAEHVTVLARSHIGEMSMSQQRALRNNPKVEIMTGVTITEVTTDASGRQMAKLSNGQTVRSDVIGAFVGAVPDLGWLPQGLETVGGKIQVDLHRTETTTPTGTRIRHSMETSIPGVFAIGDIRSESGQRIAAAVGDASIAVKEIYPYLQTLKRRYGHYPKT